MEFVDHSSNLRIFPQKRRRKKREQQRWKELESCLCSREWGGGGSFEGCRRLFVLGFLFGLLLYGLVRNVIGIFSLSMKKFHWYFGRRMAVSLQWISLLFRTIVAAIFCHPKYVTHVLCHTCSLAVLHVVMWRTKVSRTFQLGLVGVSCHVITLRLRKMSCFFCDIGFTGFSKRSLKRIIMCLSSFSSLYQIKYQQRSQIWRFFGAYKNCVAQLFDGWDHGLFRFLYYTRSLIYIL